jgi:hypothetical protein
MSANPLTHRTNQTAAPKVSVLGILFFLLGMPHVYGAFSRRLGLSGVRTAFPYGKVVMVAATLAAVIELSMVSR